MANALPAIDGSLEHAGCNRMSDAALIHPSPVTVEVEKDGNRPAGKEAMWDEADHLSLVAGISRSVLQY